MRLIAATLVAGSSAVLLQDLPTTPAEAAILKKKDEAEKERAKVTASFDEMEKKVIESGIAGGAKAAMAQIQSQYTNSHNAAVEKADHMDADEALEKLKHRLTGGQRSELSLLMKESGRATTKYADEEKVQYVKSVQTLNEMYVKIEDERTRHVLECHNEIYRMVQKVYSMYMQRDMLKGQYDKAWIKISDSFLEFIKAINDIRKEQELMKGDDAKAVDEQRILKTKLNEAEEEVALFRFILGKVSKKCEKAAKKAEKAFVQFEQKVLDKKAMCAEECAAKRSADSVMVEVFSDPIVMEEAKYLMTDMAHTRLKDRVSHLRRMEEESVNPKYSFLQMRSRQPDERGHPLNKEQPHLAIDGGGKEGCGCGKMTDNCDSMMTIVGERLECKKSARRDAQAAYDKRVAYDTEVKDQHNDVITQGQNRKSGQFEALLQAFNLQNQIRMTYGKLRQEFWKQMHELWWYRFKCVTKLQDIDNNQFCGIVAVRNYMKRLALRAFGYKGKKKQRTAVTDCVAEQQFTPDTCSQDCIAGDNIPADPSMWPTTVYRRETPTLGKQHEDLTKEIRKLKKPDPANEKEMVIAFPAPVGDENDSANMYKPCPTTTEMDATCNVFLCPVDCQVAEWGDWEKCTASCSTGKQSRTRAKDVEPKYGGTVCPDVKEERDCNTQDCDQDCELHAVWTDDMKGCSQACVGEGKQNRIEAANLQVPMPNDQADGEIIPHFDYCAAGRCRVQRKHIVEQAKGNGECWDFNAKKRVRSYPCEDRLRQCNGDEVCEDVHDVVLAYECSIKTGRLGCYYAASFVAHLLRRFPTGTYGYPNAQIALMKFGNGMSIKTEGVEKGKKITMYVVADAQLLVDLTGVGSFLPSVLYRDVFGLWGGSNYKLGFNNMGQLIKQAGTMLTSGLARYDENSSKGKAQGKIIMITRGEGVKCTLAKSTALEFKEKNGVHVQAIVFNQKGPSDSEFEELRLTVSYPPTINMMHGGPPSVLHDWSSRGAIAQSVIPTLCPGAASTAKSLDTLCEQRVEMLHRGRACQTWKHPLADKRVSLMQCRDEAIAGGFEAFQYTYTHEDVANCYTHAVYELEKNEDGSDKEGVYKKDDKGEKILVKSYGQEEYKNAEGVVRDDTCDYIPDYAKGKDDEGDYKGWMRQTPAAGNGELTHHFGVIKSAEFCPKLDCDPTINVPRFEVSPKKASSCGAQRMWQIDFNPASYGAGWKEEDKAEAEEQISEYTS
jgi:hypothetical protein